MCATRKFTPTQQHRHHRSNSSGVVVMVAGSRSVNPFLLTHTASYSDNSRKSRRLVLTCVLADWVAMGGVKFSRHSSCHHRKRLCRKNRTAWGFRNKEGAVTLNREWQVFILIITAVIQRWWAGKLSRKELEFRETREVKEGVWRGKS